MTAAGTPGPEASRNRVGFALLVVGIVLLLFAWFSWLYRTSTPDVAPPVEHETQSSALVPVQPLNESGPGQQAAFVQAAPMLLMVTFLLILVFLIGSLILVRGIRRYLAAGDHERRPPTPSDDVWSMHRAHDEFDENAA